MKADVKILSITEQRGISKSTGNEWRKLVVRVEEVGTQYTHQFEAILFGESRITNNHLAVDDVVTIYFYIDKNEWQGKWYNEINITNAIPCVSAAQPAAVAQSTTQAENVATNEYLPTEGMLPF